MSFASFATRGSVLATLLVPALLSVRASASQNDSRADFTVTIALSDARNDKGQLVVGLFDSEANFPRQGRALRASKLTLERGKAVVTFRGLEPGVYAVAVLHDENSNSKMDFNFLGMPLEGYGFSNDAPVSFGPPSFDAAAFKLVARRSRVPIRVRYFLR
jgi:uncharacterized protein (DUF2141 family)